MLTTIKSKASILRGLALILAVLMVTSMCLVGCSDATAQQAAEHAQATADAAQVTANEAKAAATSAVTTATVQSLLDDALADYLKKADAVTMSAVLEEVSKKLAEAGYLTSASLADYAKKSEVLSSSDLAATLANYIMNGSVYTKAEVDAKIAAAVGNNDNAAAIAEAVAQAKAYTDAAIAALGSTGADEETIKQYLLEHDLAWAAATDAILTFRTAADALIDKVNAKTYTGNDWQKVLDVLGDTNYFKTTLNTPKTLDYSAVFTLILQRALTTEELDGVLEMLEEAAAVVTITDKIDAAVDAAKALTSTIELKDVDAAYLSKAGNVITLNNLFAGAYLVLQYDPYLTFSVNNGVYSDNPVRISFNEFDKTVAHNANEVFWFTTYNGNNLASATLGKLTENFTANGTPKYNVLKVVTATVADAEAYASVQAAKLAIAEYIEAQTELVANATANLTYGNNNYVLATAVADLFKEVKGQGSLKWVANNNGLNQLLQNVSAEAGIKIVFTEGYIDADQDLVDQIATMRRAGGTYYTAAGEIILPQDQAGANAYKALADEVELVANKNAKVFFAHETYAISEAEAFVVDLRTAAATCESNIANAAAAAAAEAAANNYADYKQTYVTTISNLVATLTAAYENAFTTLHDTYNKDVTQGTTNYAINRASEYYFDACEVDPDAAMAAITGLAKEQVTSGTTVGYNTMTAGQFAAKLAKYIDDTYTKPCTADCIESWFKDTLYDDATYYTDKLDAFAGYFYADANTDVSGNSTVQFATVDEYNAARGTSLTAEQFAALTADQKLKTAKENLTAVLNALVDTIKAQITAALVIEGEQTYTGAYAAIETITTNGYYAIADKYLETAIYTGSTAGKITAAKNALQAFFDGDVTTLLTNNAALGSKPSIQTILTKYLNAIDAIEIDNTKEYPYLSFMGTEEVAHALNFSTVDIADYITANNFAASGAYTDKVVEGEVAMLKDTYNAIVTAQKSAKITELTNFYSAQNTGIVADENKGIKGIAAREADAQLIYNKGYKNLLDFALTYQVQNAQQQMVDATFEEYAATFNTIADLETAMDAKLQAGGASLGGLVTSTSDLLTAYSDYVLAYDAVKADLATDKAAKVAPWAADPQHPEYVHRNAAIVAYYDAAAAEIEAKAPDYKVGGNSVSLTAYIASFTDVNALKTAMAALLGAATTAQGNARTAAANKADAYNTYVGRYEGTLASAKAGVAAAQAINANGLTAAQAQNALGATGDYKAYYVEGSEYALLLAEFSAKLNAYAAEMPTDGDVAALYGAANTGMHDVIANYKTLLTNMFNTLPAGNARTDLIALTVTAIVVQDLPQS